MAREEKNNTPVGKRLKGISPLIATLILIAITIVGGILVYHVFFSTASAISTNGNVQVVSANIYSGPNIMVLEIKNTGSITVENMSIAVYQSGKNTPILTGNITTPLAPGQETGELFNGPNPPFVSGNTYTVIIKAVLSNKATTSTSTTLTAN